MFSLRSQRISAVRSDGWLCWQSDRPTTAARPASFVIQAWRQTGSKSMCLACDRRLSHTALSALGLSGTGYRELLFISVFLTNGGRGSLFPSCLNQVLLAVVFDWRMLWKMRIPYQAHRISILELWWRANDGRAGVRGEVISSND